MRRAHIVPHHHVTIRQHQADPERVVGVPKLHVGGVGGIADVQRVGQQQRAVVPLGKCLDQPGVAELPHPFKVRHLDPGVFPFAESQRSRTDLHPVIVIRGSVGFQRDRTPDLAVVGVMLVHDVLPSFLISLRQNPGKSAQAATWFVACTMLGGR